MASIFVTGSADGIGLEAARQLAAAGHRVVLHGRSHRRADQARASVPDAVAALMRLPSRLVYLSSGLEAIGRVNLADLQWEDRPWNGMQAYSDSKLYDVMLALAVARRYPRVIANAVDPGVVRTKMGGPGAPVAIPDGADTPVWLASSDEPAALESGRLVRRRSAVRANRAAYDADLQDSLLEACARLTGTTLPGQA